MGCITFRDFKSHPNIYTVQSAPWYTSVILYGVITAIVVAIALVIKWILKKSGKQKDRSLFPYFMKSERSFDAFCISLLEKGELLPGQRAVEMGNEHILGHIQTVRAQTAINGMAAVIRCKGDQCIVLSPVCANLLCKSVKY